MLAPPGLWVVGGQHRPLTGGGDLAGGSLRCVHTGSPRSSRSTVRVPGTASWSSWLVELSEPRRRMVHGGNTPLLPERNQSSLQFAGPPQANADQWPSLTGWADWYQHNDSNSCRRRHQDDASSSSRRYKP